MRAFYAGWKCKYVPTSVVYHKGSHSFNKVKKNFYYYHERNRIWFIYRNFPFSIILKNLHWIIFREIRTMINIVFIRRFPFTYIRARWDGFMGMSGFKSTRASNLKSFRNKRISFGFLRTKRLRIFSNYQKFLFAFMEPSLQNALSIECFDNVFPCVFFFYHFLPE